MTRYSVQRFRAAVLRMYLRIAVLLTLPLSLLYYLLDGTPDRGLVALLFALFVLMLRWRTRHDSEESLRYVNWFVLAMLCLMLYGTFISNDQLRQEVWMMIFPITFAPVVAARDRIVWTVVGAASIAAAMTLRPEVPTAVTTFVYVIAYLTLSFVTLLLVRHNEQNIERLAHLSIIDPLTKAYNRGYLKDVLVGEINRCKRSGQPLTVIMLDIDYFKMFNDDYGHLFGDSVLEQVAEALKQGAQRAGDYVFRYGGEEFCIVTSGLNRDEAWQFAEKLRLGIYALDIENKNSPHLRLTASAGFWCVYDTSEITPSAPLLNADNALYRAKAAGRNTVVDFDDSPAAENESRQPQGATV
ncbi:MAG: GGDEF domain-containing protein [Nitrosomonadales bacterium]|nr:GGDEF domain-containing protein [Nitrosomonadales bacterium]